eukprot:3943497-Prymnesium_polylepis.2
MPTHCLRSSLLLPSPYSSSALCPRFGLGLGFAGAALACPSAVETEAFGMLLIDQLTLGEASLDIRLGPDEEAKAQRWHRDRAAMGAHSPWRAVQILCRQLHVHRNAHVDGGVDEEHRHAATLIQPWVGTSSTVGKAPQQGRRPLDRAGRCGWRRWRS